MGVIAELTDLVKASKPLFVWLGQTRLKKILDDLLQAVITIFIFGVFYLGFYVVREEGFIKGFDAAFFQSTAYRDLAHRNSEQTSSIMQMELRVAAATDALIEGLMAEFIRIHTGVARQRLAVFHNGVVGLSGMAIIKADVLNVKAAPGRSVGEFTRNSPISEWSDMMPAILQHSCYFSATKDRPIGPPRSQLEALGVGYMVACPVVDVKNRVLGILFTDYDGQDHPAVPDTPEEQKAIIPDFRAMTSQIASAWSVRGVGESPELAIIPKDHPTLKPAK